MKFFLILILASSYASVIGQIPEGTYKSSDDSFRSNFFLEVKGLEFTFYGWETTIDGDTIYFRTRSNAYLEGTPYCGFEEFEYSSKKIDIRNLSSFDVNLQSEDLEMIFPHTFFVEIEWTQSKIDLLAGKDIYHSRADRFKFEKVE